MISGRDYCSVGKAVLIQALGTKATYTAGVRKVYLCSEETCKSCPYYNKDKSHCFSCSQKGNVPVDRKIRVNEENMYGKKERLSLNSLKTLFYLHYSNNIDSCGLITSVSLEDIADKLGITLKTVRKALSDLSDKDYISYSPTYKGCRDIFLIDYRHYHKKATAGGRGYVTFNKKVLDTLLDIKDINVARIFLRSYMELDDVNEKDGLYVPSIERNVSDIKRELPSYMRTSLLKKLLKGFDCLSYIAVSLKNGFEDIVTFQMSDSMSGKRTRKAYVDSYEKTLYDFVEGINESIIDYIKNPLDENNVLRGYISTFENARPVDLKEFDFHDLACLTDWYSPSKIRAAIFKVIALMNRNENTSLPILNVTAYIRTIMDNHKKDLSFYELMA